MAKDASLWRQMDSYGLAVHLSPLMPLLFTTNAIYGLLWIILDSYGLIRRLNVKND